MPLANGTLAAQKNPGKGLATAGPRGSKILVLDGFKSDTLFLPVAVKAFRVDVAGAVKFTVYDGKAVAGETAYLDVTRNFVAGAVWDAAPVVRVWSTGTTATGIDGAY